MNNMHAEYYDALVQKNASFEGVFFAAIKTTGIFCRPTCRARKPKSKNCEFFKTAQECLLAGYRACKICKPLLMPNEISPDIKLLIDAVENDPTKRWNDNDVRSFNLDPSTIRRQFKKRYGITFVAYGRARRMGIALKSIRNGEKMINAQIDSGYESASGFRDAFTKIMGDTPCQKDNLSVVHAEWIDTPIGAMVAMADNDALHLLEFTDRRGLEREIEKMRKTAKIAIIPGRNKIIESIENELKEYFAGNLKIFKTPLKIYGSDFQKSIMTILMGIPSGQTRSYKEQADILGNPKAVRAVARANGMNQIAIVIPCHRVIGADGSLVGYAGGLDRKKWLLNHEGALAQTLL